MGHVGLRVSLGLVRLLLEPGRSYTARRALISRAVGGAGLIPTCVSLLAGKRLAMTVLIDSRKEGHELLTGLNENTLKRFDKLFEQINSPFPEEAHWWAIAYCGRPSTDTRMLTSPRRTPAAKAAVASTLAGGSNTTRY